MKAPTSINSWGMRVALQSPLLWNDRVMNDRSELLRCCVAALLRFERPSNRVAAWGTKPFSGSARANIPDWPATGRR